MSIPVHERLISSSKPDSFFDKVSEARESILQEALVKALGHLHPLVAEEIKGEMRMLFKPNSREKTVSVAGETILVMKESEPQVSGDITVMSIEYHFAGRE